MRVHAEPARAYAAFRSLDLNRSRIVRLLFAIRTLPSRFRRQGLQPKAPSTSFLDQALALGWRVLERSQARRSWSAPSLSRGLRSYGSAAAGSGLHRVCGARLHEDRLEHGGAAGRSGFQRGEHRDSSCRHGSRFPPAVSPLLVHRRPGSSAHPNRGVTPREARPRPRHRDGSKNEGTSHVFPSLSLTYSPTTIAAGYSTSSSCCA